LVLGGVTGACGGGGALWRSRCAGAKGNRTARAGAGRTPGTGGLRGHQPRRREAAAVRRRRAGERPGGARLRRLRRGGGGGPGSVQHGVHTLAAGGLARRRDESAVFVSPRQWCRSEEHTSELQSRENLVCRLLLEKKNTAFHLSIS